MRQPVATCKEEAEDEKKEMGQNSVESHSGPTQKGRLWGGTACHIGKDLGK